MKIKVLIPCITLVAATISYDAHAQEVKVDSIGRTAPVGAAPVVSPTDEATTVSQREHEMLTKMDAAVQEIAGFYGNPPFVRLLTNDGRSAATFKERLALGKKISDIRKELADLEAARNNLLADLALRRDTLKKLDQQILDTRSTIDAIGKLVADTQKAIEDSVRPASVATKVDSMQPPSSPSKK